MHQDSISSSPNPPAPKPLERSVLLLILGLIAVCCLYGEELVHYGHALYGTKEYYVVRNLSDHPGCTIRGNNPRELTCPMHGYNSLRLGCLFDQCIVEDQNALPITPGRVAEFRAQMMRENGRMPRPQKTYDMTPREETPEELHKMELEDQQLELSTHGNPQ